MRTDEMQSRMYLRSRCSRIYILEIDATMRRVHEEKEQTCNIRTLYYYSLCHLRFLEKELRKYTYIWEKESVNYIYMYIYFHFVCNRCRIGEYKFCIFYSGTFISRGAYPFLIMPTDRIIDFNTGKNTVEALFGGKKNDIFSGRSMQRARARDSIRERVRMECCSRYARIGINDRTSGE